ncbi:MAG: retropepsin-like aspartic protease [Isosphaeraceae bacterium]
MPIAVLVLTPLSEPAKAQERSADEVLKEKGLRRSGSLFVLQAEAEASKAIHSAQSLRREVSATMMRGQLAAKGAETNKRMIVLLTQQRLQLRQRMAAATTVEQHNQMVGVMNEMGDRINLLQHGGVDAKAVQDLESAASKARGAYMQAVLDARNLVKTAESRYAELAEDAEVQAALATLNADRKEKLTLGPTRSHKADVKALDALEATIQSQAVTLREDRGTYRVDVTFNDKLTKSMIFDTGASLVCLPSDYASELGLKLGDDLPTARMQVADGRIKEGKLVKLASVRIGPFSAEDVECVVFPESSQDGVPPLLGGSFLKHFTYKLDPATGALTLSQIKAATTPTTSPKGRSGTSRKSNRAGGAIR